MDPETQANSTANSTDEAGTDPAQTAGAEAGAEGQQAQTTTTSTQPAVKTVSEEAYRALQSRADKTENELRRIRQDHERQLAEAREQSRQATLATLKPEERDAQIRSWRLEDRERAAEERERAAEETARELTIAKLSLDNGLDDEARKELDGITDVNEMRARAAELKAEKLARELEEARKAPSQQATPEGQTAPKGMRGDPAGSGQGGNRGTYDPQKFKGTGDVAGALRAQREAGAVKYERIPLRGR